MYSTKGGEKPTLSVGSVTFISNPTPKYQAGQIYQPNGEQVVDAKISVNNDTLEFKQLPVGNSIAYVGNMVIADSKETMLNEVEGMKRISQDIIDKMDYHIAVVDACEQMIENLNPQVAKERETDKRLAALETAVGGFGSRFDELKSLLIGRSSTPTKK